MKNNKVIFSISLAAALLFAPGCWANSTTCPSSSAESSKNTSTPESTTEISVDLNALEYSQVSKDVAEYEDLVEIVTNK
ncbi:peptidylprolyl isomerase, partial [Enterococcus lactis]